MNNTHAQELLAITRRKESELKKMNDALMVIMVSSIFSAIAVAYLVIVLELGNG